MTKDEIKLTNFWLIICSGSSKKREPQKTPNTSL